MAMVNRFLFPPNRIGREIGSSSLGLVPMAAILVGICASGCVQRTKRINAAIPDPESSGAQALALFDTNKDSLLSADELRQSPGLHTALARIDSNGDGQLTEAEIVTYFAAFADRTLRLVAIRCEVSMEKRPLPDATVTLVPEPFLGSATKSATAVTNASGLCRLQSEGAEYPGVQLGLYRITVTKRDPRNDRELVPARYNTDTELAVEVSPSNANAFDSPLRLELKSR